MTEIWKPIPKYEQFYEVSNLGRVSSRTRLVNTKGIGTKKTHKGKMLKLYKKSTGYLTCVLCRNGVRKYVSVHTLVLSAFKGPNPGSLICRHLDGNQENNTPENLQWGTSKENRQDTVRHGRVGRNRGERHGNTNYSDDFVDRIVSLHVDQKMSQGEIGRKYGVRQSVISRWVSGTRRPLRAYGNER